MNIFISWADPILPSYNIFGRVSCFRTKIISIEKENGKKIVEELVDVDWEPAVRNGFKYPTPVDSSLQHHTNISVVAKGNSESLSGISRGMKLDILDLFHWNGLHGWIRN